MERTENREILRKFIRDHREKYGQSGSTDEEDFEKLKITVRDLFCECEGVDDERLRWRENLSILLSTDMGTVTSCSHIICSLM